MRRPERNADQLEMDLRLTPAEKIQLRLNEIQIRRLFPGFLVTYKTRSPYLRLSWAKPGEHHLIDSITPSGKVRILRPPHYDNRPDIVYPDSLEREYENY